MKNIMKELAKLLDVELEEEFRIEGFSNRYKFSKDGLMYLSDTLGEWNPSSSKFNILLTGDAKIVKIPKPILDEKEKEYLSNVIKPFRNRVIDIIKHERDYGYQFLTITARGYDGNTVIFFPNFKTGAMYRSMQIGKRYTIKELGL